MITMTVETVTPKQAAEYLKANTQNYRSMSRAKIKQYAEDIKANRWELNGEGIQFDENGVLKNGQHRLAAIVMAGVPVQMTIIRGVSESVSVYDLHKRRTAADVANAKGFKLSSSLMSAVNLLLYLRNSRPATQAEASEYAIRHENELNRAWRCLLNGEFTRKVQRASVILSVYLILQSNKMPFYEVEVFFRAFGSGEDQGADGYEVSPAIIARKMFDQRWKGFTNQRAQREQLDVLIQAMNDMHSGRKRSMNYKISQPFAYEPLIKNLEG